jgi:hypothetical protein
MSFFQYGRHNLGGGTPGANDYHVFVFEVNILWPAGRMDHLSFEIVIWDVSQPGVWLDENSHATSYNLGSNNLLASNYRALAMDSDAFISISSTEITHTFHEMVNSGFPFIFFLQVAKLCNVRVELDLIHNLKLFGNAIEVFQKIHARRVNTCMCVI